MKNYNSRINKISLVIEFLLALAICVGLAVTSQMGLSTSTRNFATEVFADYEILTENYIHSFKILRMEAVQKMKEDPSFDEMLAWMQSKDAEFRDAVGENVYDGFAFSYKGGYVRSWDFGDYSNYDATTRPWYQQAAAANGEIVVVAPYQTYLTDTDYIETYDTLRLSIAQMYDEKISFDFDLTVEEINALLANRQTIYDGTKVFLYDKNGYILSSTDEEYYGHNVGTVDEQVSDQLHALLVNQKEKMSIHRVDGTLRQVFCYTDEEEKTICLLVPFAQVFVRNLLFVILLALLLMVTAVVFYGIIEAHLRQNEAYVKELEENRKHLSDALKTAESASHAKGDFMSRMSHEIRTPLNAITGYLDIAGSEPNLPERVEHCIDQSKIASRHLLSIVNDVLDISAIESGRMKLAHDSFDMKQMVDSLSVLFFAQAKSKKINFRVKLQELDTELLIGDELRIRQILLNLLSNAVKFTPEGGSIMLGIRQVGSFDAMEHLEFTVQDTGIGMSQEYQSHIFTPFEQETTSTARIYGGSGLGLSISNNLVNMMGGKISVQSTQGTGTTFTVWLSFDKSEENRRIASMPEQFRGMKALIVDDDADTCTYAKALLERMGIASDTVNSGKKALRRVASRNHTSHPYDFCMIDWNMKEINGIETAREMRKLCGDTMPIIIATAYDYTNIVEEAKAAGVDKIVSKPLFQSTLFDLLVSTYGKYQPVKPKEKQSFDLSGVKLLLAEDNEMNMEIAVDILTKAGFIITSVTNGQEALDTFTHAETGTFDVILMDIQMPVMDGYTAARKIRESAHPQATSIPIIAMTANAFTEDVTAALAAGMNDHVAKPISYDRLFAVLKKYMTKKD